MDAHTQDRPGNVILAALRTDLCQTTDQLAAITHLSTTAISRAACTLISSGYALRREIGCYVLSAEGLAFREGGGAIKDGPKGPRNLAVPMARKKTTMRDKIWSAMRMERKFSIDQIITLSGASRSSVAKYINVLTAYGYLAEMSRRSEGTALTSNGFKRWMLLKDTGPFSPIWRDRRGELFDRNLGLAVQP